MSEEINDETTTLDLDEALVLLRMFIHRSIGQSEETAVAHLALDRVIAVCAEHGLEAS